MRVGLISDTHGALRPQVLDRLAGVDRILHAGDVGPPDVLSDLETVAPVIAVWGNTDGWDVRALTHETIEVEIGGVPFGLAHGHTVETFEDLPGLLPGARVIVHGHSHVPRADLEGDVLVVNPGSAGPGNEGWPPSLAVAEIGADHGVTVAHFEVASGRSMVV